jgi:hypothetical protein
VEKAMGWHPFFRIDPGFSRARSDVTAVARYPEHLDLFAHGSGGEIRSAYWDDAGGWSPFFRIDEKFALARSAVSAVARNPDHLDLFVTCSDGRVHSSYWDSATGWANFFAIDTGFTKARLAVAVVARDADHLDLFVTGSDGRLYSCSWSSAGGWGTWFAIDPGFTIARSQAAVVARHPGHMDLFVTGTDGRVHSAYWDEKTGWSTFFSIDAGFTKARSAVSAVARSADNLDLFVTGSDGAVYSAYWSEAGGWGTFFRIDDRFVVGTPSVTAVARGPDRLDLLTDGSARVQTASWTSARGWTPFYAFDDGFEIAPGTSINAVSRRSGYLDVFAVGSEDGVHSAYFDPGASVLRRVTVTFDTHDDNKNDETVVHVFVKNRLNNSTSPEADADFISNWYALQRRLPGGDLDDGTKNPYLAYGLALGDGDEFEDPSSKTYTLTLARPDIGVNEVVLPAVDIQILTDRGLVFGRDRWIFDYTVMLQFDDGAFSFTSAVNGVRGIILDQDNRNYSGIGIENPLRTLPIPTLTRPDTDALLKKVTLEFVTHDDDKDHDTVLNVHIVNRLGPDASQDIAIGLDLFKDTRFPDSGGRADQYKSFSWEAEEGQLASPRIRLADMVLPVVYIVIVPNGDDRWIFDYRVTFEFENASDFQQKRTFYSSQTSGVILDQDNNKHMGVYQGRPFPTIAPPTAPVLANQPVDRNGANQKTISLQFLQRKLDEFINRRNDPLTGAHPPLAQIRLSSSPSGDLPPESYSDLQTLVNGHDGLPHYVSTLSSQGQLLDGWVYLRDIESAYVRANLDPASATPLLVTVAFKPGGALGVRDLGSYDLVSFSITLKLTLDKGTLLDSFGHSFTIVDLFSWITELEDMSVTLDHYNTATHVLYYRIKGSFLHEPVDLVTSNPDVYSLFLDQVIVLNLNADGPGLDTLRSTLRSQVVDKLTKVDLMTNRSPRDGINSQATSWLLGGVADDELNADENNCILRDIGVQLGDPARGIDDMLVIDYSGPQNVFVPAAPADWPTPGHPNPAYDFSPSTLANIDHIVVLTKENRSFDHMLGYLSLPLAAGGRGRQDVDGLKGGEFNVFEGVSYPSFPLDQTLFAPGTPNGYESVGHAIDGGRMDGFVASHAQENSDSVAGRVMGYHTTATVPVYDALARDFAIGHRWFCSHPGPTFPNRFYELTGRPNLDSRGFWELENSSPILPVFTPTIFDYLKDAKDPSGAPLTWRYFEHGYCTVRWFERYTFDHEHVVSIDDPADGFYARARSGNLPSVSFIDPHFVDYPPGSDCDEPPSDVLPGQALVRRIVESVVTSPAWPKTLLIIVYDEHGGFYDHVPPPPGTRVSADFPVATLGLRVPAFVISPWLMPGSVFGHDGGRSTPPPTTKKAIRSRGPGLHFDHTSILKTIARRFLSDSPPYMGARYAAANDLSVVIGAQPHRPQFLPFINYRLQFVASQLMLNAIVVTDPEPGAVLWQAPAEDSVVQDFSFEDAGNGFVYIRSHVRNDYVAAASADSVRTVPVTSAPGTLWKLGAIGITVLDRDLFLISSRDYPDLVLQPAKRASESAVVLAHGSPSPVGINPNAWKVTSPLLGDTVLTNADA